MTANAKHKTITLKHFFINNEKQIGLEFRPDKTINVFIKTLPNIRWSTEFGIVYIKNTHENLATIFKVFKGIAWVNGSHFFPKTKSKLNNSLLQLMILEKENLFLITEPVQRVTS